MTIVWMVLKLILWMLLGILALVMLILILPLTVYLEYSAANGFKVAAGTMGILFRCYPPKTEKVRKKEKIKKQPKMQPENQMQPETPAPLANAEKEERKSERTVVQSEPKRKTADSERNQEENKAEQETRKELSEEQFAKKANVEEGETAAKNFLSMLCTIKGLIEIAGGAIRRLLAGIWIRQIQIILPIYKQDAAQTAVFTGRIHFAAGASLGVLRNFFHMSFKKYQIEPDYTGERQDKVFFSCKITGSLIIMLIVAVWAAPKVLKTMKNGNLKILPGR